MSPSNSPTSSLAARAERVKLLLFDVDGVLTDGTVFINTDGTETKPFFIRDGIAMVWAQRAGLKVGLLSARKSATTPHRAAQLGITLVYHGVSSKLDTYDRILADEALRDEDVAYMGDELQFSWIGIIGVLVPLLSLGYAYYLRTANPQKYEILGRFINQGA